MRTALVLRHLAFEDLGSWADALQSEGYAVLYRDTPVRGLHGLDPLAADLLVVLGGPVAVYDQAIYPWLREEIGFIGARLAANRPTLGVCLGAQLMASALRARVRPAVKEIGFASLDLTAAGRAGPLAHLDGAPVLHWHGDAFELPDGAERLASTPDCPNQAFALGLNLLGLQFHPEVDGSEIESWLVGHAAELQAAEIDIPALRRAAQACGPATAAAGRRMLADWLGGLERD
jgi:GMP synthase (glutamine-hydrolysing)